MVYRIYVEKKKELANEARTLLNDAQGLLGIDGLTDVRVINRYDAENMSRELFDYAVKTVFSEPQLDVTSEDVDLQGAQVFAVEYLPGQFDQRADSAAQCIQIISQGERPLIRSAKVYALYGKLSAQDVAEIKKYVINPVEAREAALEKPATLKVDYAIPTTVKTLDGFCRLDRQGLEQFVRDLGLAMDADDIAFCQQYFRSEHRDPTITEIRMIDTYWSDHCRHTTFLTVIDDVKFEDELLQKAYQDYLDVRKKLNRQKPICLMDLATIAVKALKKQGKLDKLDESEEINACTVKIDVEIEGKTEPWLLLFKNETHNHPTEIEPFGGAATCIGGAIRDPLSGRAYVYGAMRVTGAADPTVPVSETIPGKLPQRKLVTTAAAGYSSYGNQIGLATGIVDEIYHPGYAAKRMEIGAVIAAAPQENVRRERPEPGDVVILLGGSTGRDGIGGATGSSKAHNAHSVEDCGAEVQKGNAPEERKLQRLFRNPQATRMIKRCNDFGAGGVSVAIGELAERRAQKVRRPGRHRAGHQRKPGAHGRGGGKGKRGCLPAFGAAGKPAGLPCGGGAGRSPAGDELERQNHRGHQPGIPQFQRRGQAHRGDARKAASGKERNRRLLYGQLPEIGPGPERVLQARAQRAVRFHHRRRHRADALWWKVPADAHPGHGAENQRGKAAHRRLLPDGLGLQSLYYGAKPLPWGLPGGGGIGLTFQEYFEKPGADGRRWGKPLAALLGAFEAQMRLGIGAIGGKDSMSGSFEKLDVPPTLVSFAVTTGKASQIVSPEFKRAGHRVVLLAPETDENGLPETASLLRLFDRVTGLMRSGKAVACYTPGLGGIAEAVMKMAFGNGLGFDFDSRFTVKDLFDTCYGAFILEMADDSEEGILLGRVSDGGAFTLGGESVAADQLLALYENRLEGVYACNIPDRRGPMEDFSYQAQSWPAPHIKAARPRVLIPAFPGTNCEYDSAKAMRDAGAEPEILVVNNLTADGIARSVDAFAQRLKDAQMIFIPGGFSGGDEPDGSGKFITAFFRNAAVKEGVTDLLDHRDGLICGICNGFQALIKLGLVPYGKIIDTDENCPTLTFNTIARHQSRIVRTRIASNKSPWLALTQVGEVYSVPISHGEGRFLASEALIRRLAENGQIATQYVDLSGHATGDVHFNPNDSMFAIEGITSPDGRVFGKMGHSERVGSYLYRNVPGEYDIRMFEAGVKYFK